MFRNLFCFLFPALSRVEQERELKRWYKYFKQGWAYKNCRSLFCQTFLSKGKISNFRNFEFLLYSQNGEDGIIKAIFNKIGTTNKFCVEFGIHPIEGNTILLKQKGWKCLWMDGRGDGELIKREFITAENINQLFKKYNVPTIFDLLSIDIDSNDYWVWKALTDYSPRVVIVEYNASIPPNESRAIEYDPNGVWDGTSYFGASLCALEKLAESKGYTLLTCESSGINAFFIRSDLLKQHFVIKEINNTYTSPGYGEIRNGMHMGHPKSNKEMPFV